MNRILKYELKRLLFNKVALGLLAVVLGYGYVILKKVTILGVNYTAPFSSVSFANYMLHLLPIFIVIIGFFTWRQNNLETKQLKAIMDTTAMDLRDYNRIKVLSVVLSVGIFILCAIALNVGFMTWVFLL